MTKVSADVAGPSTVPYTHSKATRAAEPAILIVADQHSATDIPASAVDDVSAANAIPTQPPGVSMRNPGDTRDLNPPVDDVLRHDGWDSFIDVVVGMKLTTKRPRLDIPTALPADLP